MTDPHTEGLAVVTGSPGVGKSALLALPTLLTEPSRREELLRAARPGSLIQRTGEELPVDTPVAAVHARGLNADQVAAAIAQALGRRPASVSALLEELDANPEREHRVIIVDAVDEAAFPTVLMHSLLIPLARQPGMRLAIGARRHVLGSTTETSVTIDLDTSEYQDPEAVVDYVHQLLLASHEPGVTTAYRRDTSRRRGGQDDAAAVAAAIAQRATARQGQSESFLIARLLALSVRERPGPANIGGEGWRAELPANLTRAFDEDLAFRLGDRAPLARVLLGALAWAKGPGLPWENVWIPVARALAVQDGATGRFEITDEDVRWLLRKAGAYISEDLAPEGRSVYRPFHDLMATYLRGEPDTEHAGAPDGEWPRIRVQTERTITNALLATIPTRQGVRDWPSAHPYVRTYLAQHAAAAGDDVLASLVQDIDFLAVADPTTLSPLLSVTSPGLPEAALIYRRARPLLGDDYRANAAYLSEAARALTGASTVSTGIRPSYRTTLASIRRDESLLTLPSHSIDIEHVAFGAGPDGQLLLAVATAHNTVMFWDPATGAELGQLPTDTGHIWSMALGAAPDGRLLLAVGDDDGTVRLWDAIAWTRIGEPLTGHRSAVRSVAFGACPDGRLLLAAGGQKGSVRVWDALSGTVVGKPLTGHKTDVVSVAFGARPEDGRLLLASASIDDMVCLWDPLGGVRVGRQLPGREVAFGSGLDGRLRLACGNYNRTVRLWDPITGVAISEPLTGHSGSVWSVAFGTAPDGRLLLASCSSDGTVRLWDPVRGAPIGQPLSGHTQWVLSVAFGTAPDGRLLLASCSSDGTVRLWDPVNRSETAEPHTVELDEVPSTRISPVLEASSVVFAAGSDGRLLLGSSRAETVRLWDPVPGVPVGPPLPHCGSVIFAGFDGGPDGRLLVIGTDSERELLWDPVRNVPVGHPFTAGRVLAAVFDGGPDGRLLLACADDEWLIIWDPECDRRVGKPWIGHDDPMTVAAFGAGPGGRLLLATGSEDGTICLWGRRGSVGKPLTGHTSGVETMAFGTGPDGRPLLASGGWDHTVRLWDPVTRAAAGEPLTGHTEAVQSVAFGGGPDCRLLASCSLDQTVRLWDLAARKCTSVIRRRSSISEIAMSGLMLAISDGEGLTVIELEAAGTAAP